MILTIRSDKPEAELGLYKDHRKSAYVAWQADRNLSKDIHGKIEGIFKEHGVNYGDLSGIILYNGPGSFTGLRIGASVANTIASDLDLPIAGSNGKDWIKRGLKLLKDEPKNRVVTLEYGSEAKTTNPKK